MLGNYNNYSIIACFTNIVQPFTQVKRHDIGLILTWAGNAAGCLTDIQ